MLALCLHNSRERRYGMVIANWYGMVWSLALQLLCCDTLLQSTIVHQFSAKSGFIASFLSFSLLWCSCVILIFCFIKKQYGSYLQTIWYLQISVFCSVLGWAQCKSTYEYVLPTQALVHALREAHFALSFSAHHLSCSESQSSRFLYTPAMQDFSMLIMNVIIVTQC